MPDNTVFANDPKIPAPPTPAPRPKTKQELYDADPDTLTTDELTRKSLFIDIDWKDQQKDLTRRQTEKMKMTDAQNRDKFYSRGLELKKTARDQTKHQDQCTHRKRGRGIEGLQKGGDGPEFAVIRHLLPWNEWYQRCQRCGKTWAPPHTQDYPDTPQGKTAFEEAKRVYKDALSWPTDNTPSTGITFKHESEDNNVSAKDFVYETIKDVTLR